MTWKSPTVAALCAAAASLAAVAATPPGTTKPTTLPIVGRAEWNSTPQPIDDARRQVPHLVTIHHAGTLWTKGMDPLKSVKALQGFGQRENHWPDVPYHYLIAPDGRIIEGRDWHYEPESNTKYPLNGVMNIELFGNFEEQRPSIEQLRSLVNLIVYLKRDVGLDLDVNAIRGHKDAAGESQTVCPGKDVYRYLSSGLIRQWVKQSLAGQTPRIAMLDAIPGGPTTMITETLAPATRAAK